MVMINANIQKLNSTTL